MIERSVIIVEAMKMLGTPWHHQGRAPGVGVDCIGLVVCVLRNLGVTIKDRSNYGRSPVPSEFLASVREHVPEKRVVDRLPGDLLLIAPGKILQHAVILVDADTIVHANAPAVVEIRRLNDWAPRIRYCFDLSQANEH